jgi:hypothetical protein
MIVTSEADRIFAISLPVMWEHWDTLQKDVFCCGYLFRPENGSEN